MKHRESVENKKTEIPDDQQNTTSDGSGGIVSFVSPLISRLERNRPGFTQKMREKGVLKPKKDS